MLGTRFFSDADLEPAAEGDNREWAGAECGMALLAEELGDRWVGAAALNVQWPSGGEAESP